ncbi:MAG TPA: tetratricopeptide repeat protein [Bryobacteraceae bacterium]|jgi:Flp pilus assembly protein TadD|nr:tetratricopeptide repeat protein [Bryobacteraceae bacterium]
MRVLTGLVLLVAAASASPDVVRRASSLYESTAYEDSLHVLAQDPAPDAAGFLLSGKNYFMMGDYKRATDFFEKALAISPNSSEYELWLGRAWGRRAETSNWLTAGVHASKVRQCFERAVALDPRNREAKNDLFDFYLNAPGFLGGGIEKAEALARSIANERPPEYNFEEAQLAERRRDYAAAETHLRRAMELAPTEAGRVVDLARFVAKRGRLTESDALFERARKMAPSVPRVAFAEARVDIENQRNLEKARGLLRLYLHASLTPDDPPREEAEKLLRRAGG